MTDSGTSQAVGWHDDIADDFDAGYRRSAGFIEREAVWRGIVGGEVKAGDRVLDAGCGSGVFSFIAAERAGEVIAIDGSANMIALARKGAAQRGLTNAQFDVAMLDTLAGWPDAGFDVILSSSVLEYVPGYENVLADLARLLRPGGRLIVSMPNARSVWRGIERLSFGLFRRPRYYAHVRNLVTPETLSAKLTAMGLTPEAPTYFANAPVAGAALTTLLPPARAKSLFVLVARKGL